jgi:hypothetical protein
MPAWIHLPPETMSYFITSADNCLFLTCEGNMSLDDVTTAWREIAGLLIATGWKRVLVDITTLQTSPDTEALFDWAKLFCRDFPQAGRIALVARWDQSRCAKLLEMLVRSVGTYLTVFVSVEQAEAWVLGDIPDKHQLPGFNSISKAYHTTGKAGR